MGHRFWVPLHCFSPTIPVASGQVTTDVDIILGSNLFTEQLEILSASVGFDGTVGVGQTEQDAKDLGLASNYDVANLTTCPVMGGDPSGVPLASGISEGTVLVYDCQGVPNGWDGYPICFSWPILPCSIKHEHIQYTRSDGEVFSPRCISPAPNEKFNDRHCLVMFDDFFNKQLPGESGRLAMDRIDIVGDLLFIGPQGRIYSGKGLSRIAPASGTAYSEGPVFIGA